MLSLDNPMKWVRTLTPDPKDSAVNGRSQNPTSQKLGIKTKHWVNYCTGRKENPQASRCQSTRWYACRGRRRRSVSLIKKAEHSSEVLAAARQDPDESAQFLDKKLWEVKERSPKKQRQEQDDEGVCDKLLARGHDIDSERDFIAVVFQTDSVNDSSHETAAWARCRHRGDARPG